MLSAHRVMPAENTVRIFIVPQFPQYCRQRLSDCAIKAEVSVEDGYLECEISPQDAHRESARAITETMLLGLKAFRMENKRHIKLIEEVL